MSILELIWRSQRKETSLLVKDQVSIAETKYSKQIDVLQNALSRAEKEYKLLEQNCVNTIRSERKKHEELSAAFNESRSKEKVLSEVNSSFL